MPVHATYTCARRSGDAPRLAVARESFDAAPLGSVAEAVVPGTLLNVNTVGDFKRLDKNATLAMVGAEVWEAISSGAAVEDPSLLHKFTVASFADLKTHTFVYWFGMPALVFPAEVKVSSRQSIADFIPVPANRRELRSGITALRLSDKSGGCPSSFLVVQSPQAVRVLPLSAFDDLSVVERSQAAFVMVDPCGMDGHPGWPLRNLLLLVATRWGLAEVTVLCYRALFRRLTLVQGVVADGGGGGGDGGGDDGADDDEDGSSMVLRLVLPAAPEALPACVGWEANARGKPGPRQMNLGALMDPARLMESAADLNLKVNDMSFT